MSEHEIIRDVPAFWDSIMDDRMRRFHQTPKIIIKKLEGFKVEKKVKKYWVYDVDDLKEGNILYMEFEEGE